jgi:polyglutamine-binding protein 1
VEAASKVREQIALRPKRMDDDTDNMDLDSDNGSDEEEDRRLEEQRRREKERRREETSRVSGKLERAGRNKRKGRGGHDDDALDPMDPASYSDVPRGGWSEGLPTGGDAKSGVDSTASGPLFQQRPYPSPGAILRANQKPNVL